jgi:hypothetical protein
MGTENENNLVLPLTSKETYLKLNKYITFDSSVTRNICFISGDHSQTAGLYNTSPLLAAQKRHNGCVLKTFHIKMQHTV